MHLLATRPGGYAAGDGVVDLGQSPAEIVLLSAADSELALLAGALDAQPADYPALRLASLLQLRSHASIDLYADRVLESARLVVVSLMGGVGYWRYGVERLVEWARDGRGALALVPGDDFPDPELEALSSVEPETLHRIWRYLREGGPGNARALLALLGRRFFARAQDAPEPQVLPRVALYDPHARVADLDGWRRRARPGRPVAGLLFYRAHLQAGNLAPFDALHAALDAAGLEPLALAVASLKDAQCRATAEAWLVEAGALCTVNTTAFAAGAAFAPGGRPVLQAIASGGSAEEWRAGRFGLAPPDLAMNVVLPEVDGRIIARAVSFKGRARRSARAESDVVAYVPDPERTAFVAELTARWAALARTPAAERRIALVLANYPARDGRIGNGVGLDTPESAVEILRALAGAGYGVAGAPACGAELMARLGAQVTNDADWLDARPCHQSLSLADYRAFLARLPEPLQRALDARWGPPERDPRLRDGRLIVAGLPLGNLFVGIQPARGRDIDLLASYHDPDLVPPHGYLAFYAWLREAFGAHAIVHVGKHGSLEWLPGKSVALGPECWPDAVLGPLPHLYPFIVNDPGEGSQAKRRAQAVIVDHLVPPLARAETYGPLCDLERLVDEYYQALALDPPRARHVRRAILDAARAAHLDRDLGQADLGDSGAEGDRFLASLDAYLCELKESQIRDGLHVFGRSPAGAQRSETLAALARLPGSGAGERGPRASLLRALAQSLLAEPGFDPLDPDAARPWTGARPEALARVAGDAWRTAGDTRERLELFARAVLSGEAEPPADCAALVARIQSEIAPALDACGPHELAGLLAGLDGRFVPPGPSGAPSRGRLDVLPTGRNFYSIDARAVPTPAAWALAQRAAERLIHLHVQDRGEYPRCIALSVWGTATMRTGGDDVAQALALLGVRPVWEPASGRVVDSEVLPLAALGRPRVDVVLRISGLFRDAFPDLIRLVDAAVRAVAEQDEPADQNPLRAALERDTRLGVERGLAAAEARRRAGWRIFGSAPGAYGAGVQAALDARAWRERKDLAEAYLRAGSFAYGGGEHGGEARAGLAERLARVDAVLQNQDNREHDILDSSDYHEFQGGLAAAVEQARGSAAALYHGDHANPEAPRVRSLREELARVVRSRAANPKWIAGTQRHGYKGASEQAATLDCLFGWSAATGAVEDHQFAALADAYLLDAANRAFVSEHNPAALREMTERLVEAMQRGLWAEPGAYREALEDLLLDAEEGPA